MSEPEEPATPDASDDAGTEPPAIPAPGHFELEFNTDDPTRATFNPNEVYLFGTLSEGACSVSLVGHWSAPNLPLAGFPCRTGARDAAVRPSDGKLLYFDFDAGELRVFTCDRGCRYFHPQDRYPYLPEMNDPIIATPPCNTTKPLRMFKVSPNSEIIHRCQDDTRWFDSRGMPILDNEEVSAYGDKDWVLLDNSLLSATTGERRPIVGLPGLFRIAARASARGFWLALVADGMSPPELWSVGLDGMAARSGVYPATATVTLEVALDSAGRLYHNEQLSIGVDRVIRRSIDGTSEVLYDEQAKPVLLIHGSAFFTGSGFAEAWKDRRVWGGDIAAPAGTSPDPPRNGGNEGPGIRCGSERCRGRDQVCCQMGTADSRGSGTLSLEPPVCTSTCRNPTPSDFTRYVASSQCDEALDCVGAPQPPPNTGEPLECCMISTATGPWGRECQPKSRCRIFACQTELDCMRISPTLRCRPERTLTGGGMTRPEVRTCQ